MCASSSVPGLERELSRAGSGTSATASRLISARAYDVSSALRALKLASRLAKGQLKEASREQSGGSLARRVGEPAMSEIDSVFASY